MSEEKNVTGPDYEKQSELHDIPIERLKEIGQEELWDIADETNGVTDDAVKMIIETYEGKELAYAMRIFGRIEEGAKSDYMEKERRRRVAHLYELNHQLKVEKVEAIKKIAEEGITVKKSIEEHSEKTVERDKVSKEDAKHWFFQGHNAQHPLFFEKYWPKWAGSKDAEYGPSVLPTDDAEEYVNLHGGE